MYWGKKKKNILRLTEEKWVKNNMEGRGKVGGINWSRTKKEGKKEGKKKKSDR